MKQTLYPQATTVGLCVDCSLLLKVNKVSDFFSLKYFREFPAYLNKLPAHCDQLQTRQLYLLCGALNHNLITCLDVSFFVYWNYTNCFQWSSLKASPIIVCTQVLNGLLFQTLPALLSNLALCQEKYKFHKLIFKKYFFIWQQTSGSEIFSICFGFNTRGSIQGTYLCLCLN